jgi:superfamily II RNA helicase
VIFGEPEEVRSQLNSSYATILNLYEKHREDLAQIYPKSYHCFRARKNEQKEAIRLIEAKINLLKQAGYIESGQLTQKGLFAKTVYGYELILSELYAQGFLEQFDEESLAAISVAVVFEPRKNQRIARLSKKSQKLKNICQDLFGSIKDKETDFRIYPFSKPPFFHLSEAVYLWIREKSFSEVLQCTDTDEGEVVRYFRMGIEILREIRDAKVATPILRKKISSAIRLINRDVVDAEKQLRES